jgi:hypothetical protein
MSADVGDEIEVAETLLGRCARPRPRLICVDGEVVDDEAGRAVVEFGWKEATE